MVKTINKIPIIEVVTHGHSWILIAGIKLVRFSNLFRLKNKSKDAASRMNDHAPINPQKVTQLNILNASVIIVTVNPQIPDAFKNAIRQSGTDSIKIIKIKIKKNTTIGRIKA